PPPAPHGRKPAPADISARTEDTGTAKDAGPAEPPATAVVEAPTASETATETAVLDASSLAPDTSRLPAARPHRDAPVTTAEIARTSLPSVRITAAALTTDTAPAASPGAVIEARRPSNRPADHVAPAPRRSTERKTPARVARLQPEPNRPAHVKRPRPPVNATVQAKATETGVLDLSQHSLIGIYGGPKGRRALIRTPSGNYVRITRGDRVDGWRVAGIDATSVRLSKGGSSKVLRLP
ncbi:MAG: hypothetical protein D6754_16155, partial [Alphaproteobacteria bacterium]